MKPSALILHAKNNYKEVTVKNRKLNAIGVTKCFTFLTDKLLFVLGDKAIVKGKIALITNIKATRLCERGVEYKYTGVY